MRTQSVIWAETSLVFCRIPPIWCANLGHQIDSRAPLDTRGSSAGVPWAFLGHFGRAWTFSKPPGMGRASYTFKRTKETATSHAHETLPQSGAPWVFLGSLFNTHLWKLKDISAIDTYGDSNPLQKEGVSTVISLFYTLMGIGVLWQMKEVPAIIILFIYLWHSHSMGMKGVSAIIWLCIYFWAKKLD